jgi:type VI secretion system protein ImpK
VQEKIAHQVHQIIGAGLDLKERLERGERTHFETEHAKLKGLLLSDGELRLQIDYAGDIGSGNPRVTHGSLRGAEPFLGIRYALACWLDETFVTESPWSAIWREQTLEVAIYGGSSQRAWRFWEQAKKAETRPGTDALEVFLWCVMLGFRGEPPGDMQPSQWVESARKRILAAMTQDFVSPSEREAPTFVPVLRGRERFGTMLRIAAVVAALIAFAAGFLLLKSPVSRS